jgi:hypothetical protein
MPSRQCKADIERCELRRIYSICERSHLITANGHHRCWPLGLPADAPTYGRQSVTCRSYHEDAHYCPGLGRAHCVLGIHPVRERGTAQQQLRRQSVGARFGGCLSRLSADMVLLVVKFEQLSRRAEHRFLSNLNHYGERIGRIMTMESAV